MTWHVIGSNGYIAQRLLARIPRDETVHCYDNVSGENIIPLDLTSFSEDNLSLVCSGDYVVMLAAISSPDICQNQYEKAYAVNVTGTKQLISMCLERGAHVLFFSSDAVVGATTHAHSEGMDVNPVGHYAKMKREIETLFRHYKNFKVFRLSYVFSRNDKFMKFLVECARKNECADVFDALYRNVVHIDDVVDAVIALSNSFDQWENTIFHLSGHELLSRKALAELYRQEICPELSFTTTMPDAGFFDARPNCIETSSIYLEALLNRKTHTIREAMKMEFGGNDYE